MLPCRISQVLRSRSPSYVTSPSCRRTFSSNPRLSTLARYDYEDDMDNGGEVTLNCAFNNDGSSLHVGDASTAFPPTAPVVDDCQLVSNYAAQSPTPVSLDWLISQSSANAHDHTLAEFLRQELPIRLAHRITDVDRCSALRHTTAVQGVRSLYLDSLRQLVTEFPDTILHDYEEEERFASVLTNLYQKHAGVLVDMARGAYQWREELGRIDDFPAQQDCHEFLDRFYMSRMGIRFLAGQYLAMRQPPPSMNNANNEYVGMICRTTCPLTCVRQAIADASFLCRRTYGRCPRVEIITSSINETFPYIPTYLHYILLELLKNALRATMEEHAHKAVIPPVRVILADGTENEDVVIKVSDEGGGIRRSQVDKIWSYLYTTASPQVQKSFVGSETAAVADHSRAAPLAGLGYGLPIARGYCRYFGGDLDVMPLEGYGTDAFVHLKRLGNSREPVPV